MKTSKEALNNYEKVNTIWKENNFSIRWQGKEKVDFNLAKKLIKGLWKQEVGTKFPYKHLKEVTGNRHTWVRKNVVSINCSRGWADIVHLWSHWIDRKINPKLRPHSAEHSVIELRCTKYFFEKDFLK